MSPCEEYLDLILRSVDGETQPEEEAALQAHLAQCSGCRALYESQKAIAEGVAGVQEAPPKGIAQGVMQEIRREKERYTPKRWLKNGKFTLIAAAAAILVLVFSKVSPGLPLSNSAVDGAVGTLEEANVPQVAAAFQEPVDTETAEDTGTAEEAEAPAEFGETGMNARTPKMAPGAGGEDSDATTREQALDRAGCQGQAYLLRDWTPEDVSARFTQVETRTLEDGTAVYGVPYDEVQSLGEALPVEQSFQIGADTETVWLILQ